ncbi:5-histidylcysteine sulfoxide synthase [Geopsychrobacter electrodiphilus]|uniref:5-histidylcysteine sulfoxide synthase n=1 Tax=Geopsychrobacter electrodiphilus TaxID=225196 RepID=UPI00036F93E0|nr:5-histidylcysteine sulfoxide synthase [Geopsychrobacter electrodiphilus]
MDQRSTRTIILNNGTVEDKRREIRDYFHQSFSLDEKLYDLLDCDAAFYLRAEPLRHPLIFYFGHTASFYINKLIVAGIISTRINPFFESMFAIGVDEMSWDDLNAEHYDWPTVAAVKAYREQVRKRVDEVIESLPLTLPIDAESPFWAIMMGIEHSRIHIETSSVIIRRLPLEMVRQLPLWEICSETGTAPQNELLPVRGGKVTLGKTKDHPLYGWDNEYGRHSFTVDDFAASQYLVSNHEFREFIEAGGYTQPGFWSEEGKSWLAFSRAERPLFWLKDGSNYRLRTLAQVINMPWDWPVEVNQLEAKAFCNWKAQSSRLPIRLPTEDEWRRMYDLHEIPDQPWWENAPGNINLEYWASPCPVNRFPFGKFYDLIGNVWQWTETSISGFAGFEVHPWYDDFSTPTFDTQHNLIKGGSWISTGNEATRDARYAFRRHFFQHAGFRYVATEQELEIADAMYETDAAVAQYCDAHFGPDKFGVKNFQAQLVSLSMAAMRGKPKERALDLGCAVGRASFELARHFESVTGIDFSARFIRIAHQLQLKGNIHYQLPEEGDIVSVHEQQLDSFGLSETSPKIEFVQGDAHNLKPQFKGYDLVIAANLIDRLSDPAHFLTSISERINPGGLLVIASPYTWLEEFTKKKNWIGAVRRAGEPFTSFEGLQELLSSHFHLLGEPQDLPFVIRETARKFQHTVSQVSIWEKFE